MRQHLVIFSIVVAANIGMHSGRCETSHKPVDFERIGTLDGIPKGIHRLGGTDRMFLIEDDWEWERCRLLIPKLPEINLKSNSLIVLTSWHGSERTLDAVAIAGDSLVIAITQEIPEVGIKTGMWNAPRFFVASFPKWEGNVEFVVNDKLAFTLLRGKSLEEFTYKTWEDFLRLHSGGRPGGGLLRRYWKQQSPTMSDEQFMEKMKSFRMVNPEPFYRLFMRDLVDTQARGALPGLFALFEAMGDHDKAFTPAWQAAVAIGGADLVEHCRTALKSPNRRSRHAAMLILKSLGLPDTREIAYSHFADSESWMAAQALELLRAIGPNPEDEKHMVDALKKLATMAVAPPPYDARIGNRTLEPVNRLIYAISTLEHPSHAAIAAIEEVAKGFPSVSIQKYAREALDRPTAAKQDTSPR
ncbi:HEAT repeat domain-containing protein [Lacipirellula sp.]|uniref:HEAT repeat domain-containing protein n=1 Tax=Lacipirellula sp. TaxID=2691419 RepID=UPI003D105BC1